ncbi:MAG: nucleotidyltransferase family protein [Candidatus Hydrogenedentes bacterium]|nr:nucleotidyltransferase family protein [Candidatus Hydrogenedentota bacterium]
MTQQEVLTVLRTHKQALREQFGLKSLSLFGSAARDEMRSDSDLDILVTFDGPATASRYFGVQFYLEDLLGRTIDLVTDKALRRELQPIINAERIDVP